MLEKSEKNRKSVLAIDKHRKVLTGTEFAKKCAFCPGCTGRLTEDKTMMFCSHVGATASLVTILQAQSCKGGKPPNAVPSNKKKRHRVQNYQNISLVA